MTPLFGFSKYGHPTWAHVGLLPGWEHFVWFSLKGSWEVCEVIVGIICWDCRGIMLQARLVLFCNFQYLSCFFMFLYWLYCKSAAWAEECCSSLLRGSLIPIVLIWGRDGACMFQGTVWKTLDTFMLQESRIKFRQTGVQQNGDCNSTWSVTMCESSLIIWNHVFNF